jgi:predicted AlkP superfamily phosphohydrolase/phosphomutase
VLALLQFDAAAVPVLERLLADDRLPNLAALRRRGTWMPIDTSATIFQSATYPTLCSGIDVSTHGLYSAFPWSSVDQRVRFMHTFPKPLTLWDRLTTSGRRSLIVDPILGWTPRTMAGVYVNGWNFEDRMLTQARSAPKGVRRAFARRHGRPPALDDVYGRRQAKSLLEWRRHLVAAPARVVALATELLASDSFDLAWINFSAAHKAGHQLWDPAAVVDEALTADVERTLRTGLDDVYVAVDAAIGRVLDVLPRAADVIVFSPTGMGANTSLADLLPAMIRAILRGKGRHASGSQFRAPVWTLRSRVPSRWRSSVARLLPDWLVADMTTRLYMRADWRRTKAIAVPGEHSGYVRLNLRGRERDGIVDPAEADELLGTIAEGLTTFCDRDGCPAIERVVRTSELTHGPAIDRLPDLVVSWSDRPAARVASVSSPLYGDVRRQGVGSGRSGNHTNEAWAVFLGGASRLREIGRPLRVTDFAATACHLLGADAAGLSGQAILARA